MGKASRKKHQQRLIKKYDVKLSQALITICDVFEPQDLDVQDREHIFNAARLAWNIANLPEEEQFDEIVKMTMEIFGEEKVKADLELLNSPAIQLSIDNVPDTAIFLETIKTLIFRKQELYPHDDRTVIDIILNNDPKEFRLQVKGMIPRPENKSI